MAEAVAMCDRIMCAFLRLSERTQSRVSPPTRRYLADLGSWLRGQAHDLGGHSV